MAKVKGRRFRTAPTISVTSTQKIFSSRILNRLQRIPVPNQPQIFDSHARLQPKEFDSGFESPKAGPSRPASFFPDAIPAIGR
jgi:hypothetical protein